MDTHKEGLAQDEDPGQACCVLCRKSYVVRYDGKDTLNQHAKSERQKKAIRV